MSTASSAPNESTEGTELYSRSTEQPNSSIQYSTQSDAPETTTKDDGSNGQIWIYATAALGACIFVFLIVLIIVCVLKRKGLCCWKRDNIPKEHQMVIVHETLQRQPEQHQDIHEEPIKPYDYKKEQPEVIDSDYPNITKYLVSSDERPKRLNSYLKKQQPLPGDVEPYNINTNGDVIVAEDDEIYENTIEPETEPEPDEDIIYHNFGNDLNNPEINDNTVQVNTNTVEVHNLDAAEDEDIYQNQQQEVVGDEDIYVNDTDKPGYMNSLGGPKIPEATSSDDEKTHRGDNGVALRKPKRPDHQKTGKSSKGPQEHNSDHGYGNIIGPNSGGITGDSDSQPNYGNINAPGGSNSAQNYGNINAPGGSNAEQNYGNVNAPGEDDMYYNET